MDLGFLAPGDDAAGDGGVGAGDGEGDFAEFRAEVFEDGQGVLYEGFYGFVAAFVEFLGDTDAEAADVAGEGEAVVGAVAADGGGVFGVVAGDGL